MRLWQGIARACALSMNTWLFVCVFCLALTPLLAFAHIQNTHIARQLTVPDRLHSCWDQPVQW